MNNSKFTILFVIFAGIAAVISVGLLVQALLTQPRPAEDNGAAPATSIAAAPPSPTLKQVVLPTTTPQPPVTPPQASATVTPPPSLTAAEPTATDTPTGGDMLVTIISPANLRTGPGLNYPVIAGLEVGKTAPLLGRDSLAKWYVISYAGAKSGQAWVSALVAAYAGDINSLPALAAPPPPPPTNTPVPQPTSPPPPPATAHGLTGELRLCSGKTAYAANERVCFIEKIVNTTNAAVKYGLIGVAALNQSGGANQYQTSWDGAGTADGYLGIDPLCTGPTDRCKGEWEDGIRLPSGTYKLVLSICYSAAKTCAGGGEWENLTPPITITVQ